jgi:hypothetical protein
MLSPRRDIMTADKAMSVINSLDEIPSFASEDEEAAFWETHELSPALWRSLPKFPEHLLPPTRPAAQPNRQPRASQKDR